MHQPGLRSLNSNDANICRKNSLEQPDYVGIFLGEVSATHTRVICVVASR